MEYTLAVYHKDCIDGTSAAAVTLRAFPNAQCFPLPHAYTAEDLDAVIAQATSHATLYTVDCALGVKEFLARGVPVVTIDHHKGMQAQLEALSREYANYTYVFDNEKSGASLAWSYFFPEEKEPDLIKYVEDADLWKWKYGKDTKDVNNYLSMFRNDPKAMLALIEGGLDEVRAKGEIISMYADKEIAQHILLPAITLRVGAQLVPAYNITSYESACGNTLSEKLDKAVALFTIRGAQVKLSFRSKEGQQPTSLELAASLGGGGHVHAAGATISLQEFIGMIVQ